MTLQADLLKQARFLAVKEPRRPSQASLRRAVSATYYALFHLLVDEATRLMLSGRPRGPLRDCLARAFSHSAMKQAANQFAQRRVSRKLSRGFDGRPIQPGLTDVAQTFVELQAARHRADYDRARRFTRGETLDLIESAERAFRDWRDVRGTLQADTFLTALLAYRQMHG